MIRLLGSHSHRTSVENHQCLLQISFLFFSFHALVKSRCKFQIPQCTHMQCTSMHACFMQRNTTPNLLVSLPTNRTSISYVPSGLKQSHTSQFEGTEALTYMIHLNLQLRGVYVKCVVLTLAQFYGVSSTSCNQPSPHFWSQVI